MDQVAKQSTVDRIAQANNVLVTVSANPSVDQLAAAIGLTLFLNKNGKHATAVFSGDVPSTLEFLQPEKTIERNTDSLRDFIIALDKAKADKLRYKVEDKVVKIFITPYRTSISEKDFDFSQGDFNVDVIIALGVHTKEELDHAIIAHGRILHDATVISINNTTSGSLGTINWQDQQASSLCEMLVELGEVIKADSFDAQMATAFLTGIVAETQRFSNEKTTSRTMSYSAKLMAAGANQQLVATQLQSKSSIAKAKTGETKEEAGADGTLEIDHDAKESEEPEVTLPEPKKEPAVAAPVELPSPIGDVRSEDQSLPTDLLTSTPQRPVTPVNTAFPAQEPSRGGTLTANTKPEDLSPAVDPLSPTKEQPLMQRGTLGGSTDNNLGQKTISNIEDAVVDQDKTLTDIEQAVDSPHVVTEPTPEPVLTPEPAPVTTPTPAPVETPTVASSADIDSVRNAVAAAANESTTRLEPRASVGASMPLEINNAPEVAAAPATPVNSPIPPDPGLPTEQTAAPAAAAPPPVPPPMTMPFGGGPTPPTS